jgi:ABC-2 type transport system ATP-binding protein
MIQLEKLSKWFGSELILDDLSAAFEPGKVYGIVGENGAGKTTLFKCMIGLESYQGQIHSDLNPIKDYTGYLPTDLFFFERMTGREYLQLMAYARRISMENLDAKNLFQLPLDQYASTYSTGMKKKLALTALWIQKNEFFILDEPFNGVDLQSNMILAEIIKKLKSLGKTILITSHIFSTLYDLCDEIFYLSNGRWKEHVYQPEFSKLESILRDSAKKEIIEQMDWS